MIGLPHVHYRTIDSTNARARELAAAGAPHGTLVTADEQTAGRGRQGRAWLAAPGDALLMSVVLRGVEPIVPLAAAVAVAETVGETARIKWPNDIWIDRRKVAGILLEGRPQEGWAVLGIGLNVRTREFPHELKEIATSLALAGTETSAGEVLAELIGRLEGWTQAPAEDVLAAWAERDALAGERVEWAGGAGVARGVDGTGALVVEEEGGSTRALDAGEVHLSAGSE